MIEQIKLLKKLQDLDLKILELENERQGCTTTRDQLAETLKTLAERLGKNRSAVEELEQRRRKGEENHAIEKTNLKKWKARLNESRNSRESIALVREIDLQEKSNKQMEEEILKLMLEIDEVRKLITTDEAEEAGVRKQFEEEDAKATAVMNAVAAKQADLMKDRAGYTKAITPENIGRYDFIRKRRMGIAVTPVEETADKNHICSGCHMAISPHLFTILVQGETLEACPTCSRIIYAIERVFGEGGETPEGA